MVLKSDQGGIESEFGDIGVSNAGVRWNQTKVGLKESRKENRKDRREQLKSDQGGIESWWGWSLLWDDRPLKSDQDGIKDPLHTQRNSLR